VTGLDVGRLVRLRNQYARLYADPALTGDTLLLALAMSDLVIGVDPDVKRREQADPFPRRWIHEIDAMVNGTKVPNRRERELLTAQWREEQASTNAEFYAHHGGGIGLVQGTPTAALTVAKTGRKPRKLNRDDFTSERWVMRVMGADFPRYEPTERHTSRCVAPMIRREGSCGRSSSTRWLDRDPETGIQRWVGLCSRHATPEAKAPWDARIVAWRDNGSPLPPVNMGGHLARHFNGDWDALYAWACPWRDKNNNREPPRPKLRLITNTPDEDGNE
jgi:hypothetical protein